MKLFFTHKPLAMQNNRIVAESYQKLIRRDRRNRKTVGITGFFDFSNYSHSMSYVPKPTKKFSFSTIIGTLCMRIISIIRTIKGFCCQNLLSNQGVVFFFLFAKTVFSTKLLFVTSFPSYSSWQSAQRKKNTSAKGLCASMNFCSKS